MKSSASFSSCKKYRWGLTRLISDSKRELIFIGLNPSLATGKANDRTLCRLISFTKSWGYGSLKVINLFALISKEPNILKYCKDPIGLKNDYELKKSIRYWSKNFQCDLWIGWGLKGEIMDRHNKILKMIKDESTRDPLVIGLSKNGHPLHPLYVSKKKKLYPLSKFRENE